MRNSHAGWLFGGCIFCERSRLGFLSEGAWFFYEGGFHFTTVSAPKYNKNNFLRTCTRIDVNARFEGKTRQCGLMRGVAQAAAFELVPTEAAGPQDNPEPRFQDEFVALEVAQFFFVRRQISCGFFDHQKGQRQNM